MSLNESYGNLEVSSSAMIFLESIPRNKKLSVVVIIGQDMREKIEIAA